MRTGLSDGKAPGKPPELSEAQKAELAGIVERGPDAAKDGIVRRRCRVSVGVIGQRF